LPDGKVYATDKALKYAIKNYIKDIYPNEKVFYFKRLKKDFIPFSLEEAYDTMFAEHKDTKNKMIMASDILSCIDIRLFGATFAKKGKNNVALSIHGPAQINHGINIWKEGNIFSEQIMSPFRNPDEKSAEKEATTLGRQSKLQEGHYLHHFSVNPKNLNDIVSLTENDTNNLSVEDINILKEALRKGATYYDSAAKAGTENELLIWVELKENSKLVLPNFSQLIKMKDDKENGLVVLDLSELKNILSKYNNEIEKIEIFRNKTSIKLENSPESCKIYSL
jgi:CRISPR-associated protein Csh2